MPSSEVRVSGFVDSGLLYATTISFVLNQHPMMNKAINHGRSEGIDADLKEDFNSKDISHASDHLLIQESYSDLSRGIRHIHFFLG